jgi:hypothetical protein
MIKLEHLLHDGETVALRLRPHPIIYLRSAIWAALAVVMAVVALFAREPRLWLLAALLMAGGGAAAALETMFFRRNVELAVTDRRVLLLGGMVQRRLVEAFPAALPGFEMSQGLLGRTVGYAQVRIRGTGDGSWLALPEPDRLRRRIEELALGSSVPDAPAAAPRERPEAPLISEASSQVHEGAPEPINGHRQPPPFGAGVAALRPQASLDRF